MSGFAAQAEGLPISACPYPVGTPGHLAWVREWISAEANERQLAGTFGPTPEQLADAMELAAVELRPDPCQEVIDNLAEMARDDLRAKLTDLGVNVELLDAQHPNLSNADMEALIASMEHWRQAFIVLGSQLGKTLKAMFEQFAVALKPIADLMAGPPSLRKAAGLPLPKLCPRHGEDLRGGLCRRCARERDRAAARRR